MPTPISLVIGVLLLTVLCLTAALVRERSARRMPGRSLAEQERLCAASGRAAVPPRDDMMPVDPRWGDKIGYAKRGPGYPQLRHGRYWTPVQVSRDPLRYGKGTTCTLDEAIYKFEEFYEGNRMDLVQRFMGMNMGQFPIDQQLIQEMLYDVKPDLIIEMGTRCAGGTAWLSSLMELINPQAEIWTVDVDEKPCLNQTRKHPILGRLLQRVHFILGDAVAADTRKQVYAAAAAKGGTTLVILDDLHNERHVFNELNMYAPLVSEGSYILVQDTKMAGVMRAARSWQRQHSSEFIADTRREYLLYSQHKNGWLKRVAPSKPTDMRSDTRRKVL